MTLRAASSSVLGFSLALVVAGSPSAATAAKVDLSPAAWPPGELAHYTHLQNNNSLSHPPARSKKGLVVGTTGALAVRSGVEALRQGGTAVDAVLTTALAQTTLNAGATVSFAGKMALVYYEASTGEIHYLNGSWDVPRGQTSGDDIAECEVPDGRQVLVPGFMSGLETAHDEFGELPFKALFGPALYFANQGFEIFPMLGSWIHAREATLTRLEGGREIFLKSDGSIYRTGDWFRQPQLAKTLKKVSRKGSRYMYRGRWAKELAEVVQSEGGRLSIRDLKAYRPLWSPPEVTAFDGHVIHGPGLPGTGGLRLREAFTSLSGDQLRAEGHYTESDEAFALMLDAVARTHGVGRPGGSHSDGVLAIDSRGNVAALLHTINTIIWGATGIFVDGVSVADVGCWASPLVTDAGPGGRLATGELVAIATRDGQPVLASSGVGSGLFETGLFSIVNVLTYGMNPQQAATTPTAHVSSRWFTQVIHRVWEDDFERRLLLDMQGRGYVIDELPRGGSGSGWSVGATIDPESGKLMGATAQAWNGMAGAQ
ncbi:MAG: gamma-glutamyltransferase family protein [Acidobacteriota bacterium]|nr:gamma-glutamyltransferase family protein [Acidobacteriota bacterium]